MRKDIDWSKVSEEMARTILDRGDTYLKAQLDISLASDRRALTVASVFGTVGTGVAGVAIAYFNENADLPIAIFGIATAASMIVGALYALRAARPIKFYSPGSHPDQWWPFRRKSLARMIGFETQNVQENIEHNEKCLAENARLLELGSRWAIAAPVIGFILWAISFYLYPS